MAERAAWHGKLWCILDAKGALMLHTVASTRAQALGAYESETHAIGIERWEWEPNRRRLGLRCVPFVAHLEEEA